MKPKVFPEWIELRAEIAGERRRRSFHSDRGYTGVFQSRLGIEFFSFRIDVEKGRIPLSTSNICTVSRYMYDEVSNFDFFSWSEEN